MHAALPFAAVTLLHFGSCESWLLPDVSAAAHEPMAGFLPADQTLADCALVHHWFADGLQGSAQGWIDGHVAGLMRATVAARKVESWLASLCVDHTIASLLSGRLQEWQVRHLLPKAAVHVALPDQALDSEASQAH